MPIKTLAPAAQRGIAAAALVAAATLALALILAPGDLAAQSKSDKDFATEIETYLTKNRLGSPAPSSSMAFFKEALEGDVTAPRARVRPLTPSESSAFQSFELESKRRALRVLDDAIQQEVLREGRLP